eukprot:9603187-Lingulodinium_polyedra.AAC.1
MELVNSRMRSTLNKTNGKGMHFESVAMLDLGSAIAASHANDQVKSATRARGRPKKVQAKRQHFDGWMAY